VSVCAGDLVDEVLWWTRSTSLFQYLLSHLLVKRCTFLDMSLLCILLHIYLRMLASHHVSWFAKDLFSVSRRRRSSQKSSECKLKDRAAEMMFGDAQTQRHREESRSFCIYISSISLPNVVTFYVCGCFLCLLFHTGSLLWVYNSFHKKLKFQVEGQQQHYPGDV
jgi:hypothetical protein